MAEKEERILCIETDEKIVEVGYGDFYNTMPKKQAINRMAEAMNDLTRKALESKKTPCIPPETYAEAMLNSILEVK